MRKKTIDIISFVIFLIAMAMIVLITLPLITSYKNPAEFKAFIESFGVWGFPIMLCIQIFQVVVALIPGEAVETLTGVLYGTLGGFLFCSAGILIGETIIFYLVKNFGKDFAEKVTGSQAMQKFSFLKDENKLKSVIFFLFFIPGTPKDLITYIAPLTKISLKDFLIITLIARIPSIISSTYGGSVLAERDFWKMAIVYGVIALFSLGGIFIYQCWEKRQIKRKNA